MTVETKENKDFWDRHWKWMVPLIVLGGFLVIGLFIFGIGFAVLTGIKSSTVYETAVTHALAHPAVLEELGTPVETGWWVSGSINVSGPSGDADLAIPLCGLVKTGTLYLIADKRAGQWRITLLEVAVDESKQRIDLMSHPI